MTPPLAPPPPFVPASWLRNAHAQTLFAFFARPRGIPRLHRERWEMPDGDFLEVDLLAPRDSKGKAAPHVLVLHGLEGSSRSGYVRGILRGAHQRGWGAAAMNFRTCGGAANRLLRAYSCGDSGDPRWVLAELRRRGVTGPLLAVGFSLGANVLLKLLAEDGDRAPLARAVAVSAPLDLLGSAKSIDEGDGMMALYRWSFLRSLKAKALAKAAQFPGAVSARAIRAAQSLQAFDDAFTAPVSGFRDADDYYRRASSGPLLQRIRRPTLLISADDDPLVPPQNAPEGAAENPHLAWIRTTQGGHVGFVSGALTRPVFWAEDRALEFLADL